MNRTAPRQPSPRSLLPFFIVALAMRPAIACIPSVLVYIERDGVLSPATAGLLLALPVLCYGVCGPLGAVVVKSVSLRSAVLVCMITVTAGTGARVADSPVWLWIGTAVLSLGVACGNVLMPAVIRANFPRHVGPMTGAYAAVIGLGASLSAGLTVPLTNMLGGNWRVGTGVWGLLSAAAAVAWIASRLNGSARGTVSPGRRATHLIGSALAWQVTLVMAMQSLQYQSLASWLPTIYVDHGLSVASSGVQLSIYTLLGIPASLVMSAIVNWVRRPSLVVLGVGGLNLCGLGGLLVAPAVAPFAWSCILGLSQGAAVSLALIFITTRARSISGIAELSAMAQSIGYGIAFLGPLLMGSMHSVSGSWALPIGVLIVSLGGLVWSGLLASREGYVDNVTGATAPEPAGSATRYAQPRRIRRNGPRQDRTHRR